jgi:hypothetical protein
LDNRNLLLAVVLSGLLILGWDVGMRYFYPEAALSADVLGRVFGVQRGTGGALIRKPR